MPHRIYSHILSLGYRLNCGNPDASRWEALMYMFGWKEVNEAYGAFPPVSVISISMHKAKLRQHICAECFSPIHIGQRYTCTVYREDATGKVSQYKCHVTCPYDS